jgi:tellurite resistance protein
MSAEIDHKTALIYTMVLVSAADAEMTDRELLTIGELVRTLPVFRDFDEKRLTQTAADCARRLGQEGGLDQVLEQIKQALPARLRETAYAVACDVAASDLDPHQEALRLLEMLRDKLGLDRLTAAAIERGSRARYSTV